MPPMEQTIAAVTAYCKEYFTGSRHSHDWEHTLRVYKLCMHIGAIEKADLEVLSLAAYLHDIGRPYQDASHGRICHAQKGAEMAREILSDAPIAEPRKENIIHCILTHRYRNHHIPESLEARVLFDADKLDAIGAVGIARAYLFAGEVGARLHNPDVIPEETRPYSANDTGYREYMVKLQHIRNHMLTAEGSRMAADRHAFMEQFFTRFLAEHEGME